jgi:hypothetical protein
MCGPAHSGVQRCGGGRASMVVLAAESRRGVAKVGAEPLSSTHLGIESTRVNPGSSRVDTSSSGEGRTRPREGPTRSHLARLFAPARSAGRRRRMRRPSRRAGRPYLPWSRRFQLVAFAAHWRAAGPDRIDHLLLGEVERSSACTNGASVPLPYWNGRGQACRRQVASRGEHHPWNAAIDKPRRPRGLSTARPGAGTHQCHCEHSPIDTISTSARSRP